MMLENELRSLIQSDPGRIVFIVGAGVSIGALRGSPIQEISSWTGLLRNGLEYARELGVLSSGAIETLKLQLAQPYPSALLAVAHVLEERLGAPKHGEYRRWLRETVGTFAHYVQDSSVLSALATFQRRGALLATTNYDDLLESATSLPSATWLDLTSVERTLHGVEPHILHLHGHWRNTDSIVLGPRSYEDVIRSEHARTVLRSLRTGRIFVFVGCGAGLQDPNIGSFLQWTEQVFEGSEFRHFRLCRDSELEEAQGLRPAATRIALLSYGPNHSDLAPFLNSLIEVDSKSASVSVRDVLEATRYHRHAEARAVIGRTSNIGEDSTGTRASAVSSRTSGLPSSRPPEGQWKGVGKNRLLYGSISILVISIVVGVSWITLWERTSTVSSERDSQTERAPPPRVQAPELEAYFGVVRRKLDRAPIVGARVSFLATSCDSQTTDARGHFNATDCPRVAQLGPPAVQITLPNRTIACDEFYPLVSAPQTNEFVVDIEECELEPVQEMGKIRVTYLNLNGALVDLLVSGKIAQGFNMQRDWFVLKTPPFGYLKALYNDISYGRNIPSDFEFMTYRLGKEKESSFSSRALNDPAIDALYSSPTFGLINRGWAGMNEAVYAVEEPELQRLLRSGGWSPVRLRNGKVAFWHDIDSELLDRIDKQWLKDLLRPTIPPGFLIVALVPTEPNPDGPGCSGYGAWRGLELMMDMRYLSVSVALVENIGDETVNIGKMRTRTNLEQGIRLNSTDHLRLAEADTKTEVLYAPQQLAAGDAIVIPLAIELRYVEAESRVRTLLTESTSAIDLTGNQRILGKAQVPISEIEDYGKVDAIRGSVEVDFDSIQWSQESLPDLDSIYIYGPSFDIDAIRVDGMDYEFRAQTGTKFVFHEGVTGLSCPYVYATSPGEQFPTKRGEIMVGQIGKSQERLDSLELSLFTGSVVLRENEPEVSYVDEVYFVDAEEGRIWRPKNRPRLERADGEYEIMHRGELISIEFGEWPEGRHGHLYSYGYYMPE